MRGFNTGFSNTAADADVIWQINRLHKEHSLSLCVLWRSEPQGCYEGFEGLFEKIEYSYMYDVRIREKQ